MSRIMSVVNKLKGNEMYHTQAAFLQGANGVVVCNKNYRLAVKICSAEEVNKLMKELQNNATN